MENKQQPSDDDLIINLTIDGTEYEDVGVNVTDPNKSIRELIYKMVEVFNLPKMDLSGTPILYMLAKECGHESEILEYEDENGHEQNLRDYGIKSGDYLRLATIPVAYGCPIPDDLQQNTLINKKTKINRLKSFLNKLHR